MAESGALFARKGLVTGLSLIVFTDEVGPKLISSTDADMMDRENLSFQFNLAHRLVLICGIGDTIVELEKLHGPVEIPEMQPTQVVWIFPLLAKDDASIDDRIRRKGRLILFAIHSHASHQKRLRPFEAGMEMSLRRSVEKLRDPQTAQFSMGMIRQPEDAAQLLSAFYKDLTALLDLRLERERIGRNLFHLGTIKNLPEDLQQLAQIMINYPEDVMVSEIESQVDFDKKTLIRLLEKMEMMGYIRLTPKGDDSCISAIEINDEV
ncbi:MAG: hypothetical protein ACFFB3_01465 [Candidatus Hodarchaeota archaeon]